MSGERERRDISKGEQAIPWTMKQELGKMKGSDSSQITGDPC